MVPQLMAQSNVRSLGSGVTDEDGDCVKFWSHCEEAPSPASASRILWLGGEPSLLGAKVEEQGVQAILNALTEEERKEIIMKDTTMPIRHFRAEKGNTSRATEKLRNTLKWRKEVDVDAIVNCGQPGGNEELRKAMLEDFSTGRMYVRGYDKAGRAVIVGHTHRPPYRNDEMTYKNVVHVVEKALACTRKRSLQIGGNRSLEKAVIVVDYRGFTLKDAIPLKLSKRVINMVQNHYPERISRIYVVEPPLVFRAMWRILQPFIDPVTKQKIVMCTSDADIKPFVDSVTDVHKLEDFAGGTKPIRDFDAEEYLKLPLDVCFDE